MISWTCDGVKGVSAAQGVQSCPTPEGIDAAAVALRQIGAQLGAPREEGVAGFDKAKHWDAALGLASTCAHPKIWG